MPIDEATFEHLTHAVRVNLDAHPGASSEALRGRVNDVLDWIASARTVNVEGVQALIHPGDPHTRFRDDEVSTPLGAERALRNAPVHDAEFFLVPRVVEDNG